MKTAIPSLPGITRDWHVIDADGAVLGQHVERRGVARVGLVQPVGAQAADAELLAALDGVPDSARGAAYVCVAAIAHSERGLRWARGETRGRITAAAQGTNGFGYDPVFAPAVGTAERTFAEMLDTEKNTLSHRARAVHALAAQLRS